MICQFCSKDMPDYAMFCSACGKQMPTTDLQTEMKNDLVQTDGEPQVAGLQEADGAPRVVESQVADGAVQAVEAPEALEAAQADVLHEAVRDSESVEPQKAVEVPKVAGSTVSPNPIEPKPKKLNTAKVMIIVVAAILILSGITAAILLNRNPNAAVTPEGDESIAGAAGAADTTGTANAPNAADTGTESDATTTAPATSATTTATTTSATSTTTTASATTTATTTVESTTTGETTSDSTTSQENAVDETLNMSVIAMLDGAEILQYELLYDLFIVYNYSNMYYDTAEQLAEQAFYTTVQRKMLENLAKERGLSVSEEDSDYILQVLDYIDQIALSNSLGESTPQTGDEYMLENYGVNKSQYKGIMESDTLARNLVEQEYIQMIIPDDYMQERYDQDASLYGEATVRHILFLYEGPFDLSDVRTREESEQLAQETLDRINAGEDMAELVQELSEDGDLTNEGVYIFRRTENFVQSFLDWSFDPDRQIDDVGICETEYGYHIMRLEDLRILPFEEVYEEILEQLKIEGLDEFVLTWQNDPRFQAQVEQAAFDAVLEQFFDE